MIAWLHPRAADRRIIGGSTFRSITPWIVAVMSFTILLIAASGLLVAGAASTLERSIERRYSLEVPGGANVEALAERMRALPGVASVEPVSEAEMRATLEKWLGGAAASPDLPVPALATDGVLDLPNLAIGEPQATVSGIAEVGCQVLRQLRHRVWRATPQS